MKASFNFEELECIYYPKEGKILGPNGKPTDMELSIATPAGRTLISQKELPNLAYVLKCLGYEWKDD